MLPLEVMALRVGDLLPAMEPFVPETTRLRGGSEEDVAPEEAEADEPEAEAVLKTEAEASSAEEEEKDSRQRETVDLRAKIGLVSLASARWKGPKSWPRSSKKFP